MPRESRVRDLEKDKINQIDDFLKNVDPIGFWKSDIDTNPFLAHIEKYYEVKRSVNRFEYYDNIVQSIKNKNKRESIGTNSLFDLQEIDRFAVEDVAKALLNYIGEPISYADQLLCRSYILATDQYRSKTDIEDNGGFYVEANVENKMKESDLVRTLASLDKQAFISFNGVKQDFENIIARDVIRVIADLPENDSKRDSLISLVSIAAAGFDALLILDKFRNIASKLNPVSKSELDDIEAGYKVGGNWKNKDKNEKSIDETISSIRDFTDDLFKETYTDIDTRAVEDMLYKVSPGVINIAQMVLNEKYPVSVQQKDAENLDASARLAYGMSENDNGFLSLSAQLAFGYVLASYYKDDSMEELADEYFRIINPPKNCDFRDSEYKLREAVEFGLDTNVGELALYSVIAQTDTEDYDADYERYIKDAMTGAKPVISLASIRDYLGKRSSDSQCRDRDVTIILENALGSENMNYRTQVKSELGSYIANAFNRR